MPLVIQAFSVPALWNAPRRYTQEVADPTSKGPTECHDPLYRKQTRLQIFDTAYRRPPEGNLPAYRVSWNSIDTFAFNRAL